ncbi:MAG: glycosyltransferase family 2 protein [Hydrogenophaga sp.]|nr:glycosyltransferase family 2 protein [Hydrogenophaga sp.]
MTPAHCVKNAENPPKVYIVILNWNGWKDTVECLESVCRLDYGHVQVVVCDNDSSDDSLTHIRAWADGQAPVLIDEKNPLRRLSFPNIPKPVSYAELSRPDAEASRLSPLQEPLILIQTGGNLGFAGGNNVGLRFVLQQGDAAYVWLLNNDTVVEPDALSTLVEQCISQAQTGRPFTSGSLVCFYSDPEVIQALGGSQFNERTGIASQTLGRFKHRSEPVDHAQVAQSLHNITGCTWLLPITYLHDVGLMEESYFLYYEEIDWTMRAGQRYGLTYAPGSVVYHKEGSSIGSKTIHRAPSLLAEYFMTRSKVRFMRRFFPWRLPVVYVFSLAQALNRMKQGFPQNGWTIFRALLGLARKK